MNDPQVYVWKLAWSVCLCNPYLRRCNWWIRFFLFLRKSCLMGLINVDWVFWAIKVTGKLLQIMVKLRCDLKQESCRKKNDLKLKLNWKTLSKKSTEHTIVNKNFVIDLNTLKQFVGFCRQIVWVYLAILWGWRLNC